MKKKLRCSVLKTKVAGDMFSIRSGLRSESLLALTKFVFLKPTSTVPMITPRILTMEVEPKVYNGGVKLKSLKPLMENKVQDSNQD